MNDSNGPDDRDYMEEMARKWLEKEKAKEEKQLEEERVKEQERLDEEERQRMKQIALDEKIKKRDRYIFAGIAYIFLGFIFLVVVAGIIVMVYDSDPVASGPKTETERIAEPEPISEYRAFYLCRNAYKEAAKYGVDIGGILSGDHVAHKLDDRWVFKLEGKMQNGFGAWIKTFAHCEVPFETESVSKIEFTQR